MGFVFYDTETTGIETSFDQILQFAAIYTDDELNEIDRFEIRSRILPNVVPSPGAMRITGVKAAQLVDSSLPSHYEMMCRIQQKLLVWSPSMFLGYNSIEFDEHLLRYSFYKTLHMPYLTNTNGNSRSDVLRMTQATHLFCPEAIRIPKGAKGRLSFKLEAVAPANGYNHQYAHDALADVEATIYICRLLLENAPEVWSSFMRFSNKAAAIDYVSSEPIFNFSDFYFGKPFSCLATGLRQSAANSASYYIYDLSVDPDELMELDDNDLLSRLGAQPKVVRSVRCNASPMLMPYETAPAFVLDKAPHYDELERRVEVLQSNDDFCERLVTLLESSKVAEQRSQHVEKQLYDGFFPEDDQHLFAEFHAAPWEKRVAIVGRFVDARLRKLGYHLIHTERPDVLDAKHRLELDIFLARRLLTAEDDVPWLTLPKAEMELVSLLKQSSEDEKEFYAEHLALVQKRRALAEAIHKSV
jgi:exodeoxyribonuclease-1